MTSLGINFSDSCNWAEHIENITAAAWTRWNLLFYKTDSDKTVKSFSFVTRVPFSTRKSLTTIDARLHAYYFHSYGRFIAARSDLSVCCEFSQSRCMDK